MTKEELADWRKQQRMKHIADQVYNRRSSAAEGRPPLGHTVSPSKLQKKSEKQFSNYVIEDEILDQQVDVLNVRQLEAQRLAAKKARESEQLRQYKLRQQEWMEEERRQYGDKQVGARKKVKPAVDSGLTSNLDVYNKKQRESASPARPSPNNNDLDGIRAKDKQRSPARERSPVSEKARRSVRAQSVDQLIKLQQTETIGAKSILKKPRSYLLKKISMQKMRLQSKRKRISQKAMKKMKHVTFEDSGGAKQARKSVVKAQDADSSPSPKQSPLPPKIFARNAKEDPVKHFVRQRRMSQERFFFNAQLLAAEQSPQNMELNFSTPQKGRDGSNLSASPLNRGSPGQIAKVAAAYNAALGQSPGGGQRLSDQSSILNINLNEQAQQNTSINMFTMNNLASPELTQTEVILQEGQMPISLVKQKKQLRDQRIP